MRSQAILPLVVLGAAVLCGCGDDAPATRPEQTLPTELRESDSFSGDNAYVHCAALCALGPRPTGSPAYYKQVEYLQAQLSSAGWGVQGYAFTPIPGRRMLNVHAVFGAPERLRPLVISCHIDTKGQGKDAIPGADDGASGAAALLELARILARTPQLAEQVELVFFDGEESFGRHITDADGLFGSRYDVQRRGSALPRWLINLDMVGGAGKTIGVPIADTSMEMYAEYEKAIRALGLSEDRWTLYPGSYLDDHRAFADAGVETLNLIAMFQNGNWWHTMRDDMSRISPASLEETGRLVLQLVQQLLAKSN